MEICYDESFWEEFEILMYDRDRMENTERDVKDLISLMGIKTGEKLLDVCCGFGRNSKYFALNNIDTTGIDITEFYLNRAKKEGNGINNLTYIHGDIVTYNETNRFDYAINMYTSFGLLESEDDEVRGLENIFNALKPGGKYLIDIQGKELTCRDFEPNIWFESGGIKVFLKYSIDESFTLLKSTWMYYKDNKMHETSFNTRMYSALELASLMSTIGFNSVEIYGDYKGNPYDINAKRLVVIGIK